MGYGGDSSQHPITKRWEGPGAHGGVLGVGMTGGKGPTLSGQVCHRGSARTLAGGIGAWLGDRWCYSDLGSVLEASVPLGSQVS